MRRLWTLIPIIFAAAFITTATVAYQIYLPKVKSWILVEVEEQSKKHTPFRIWPQKVDLQFFPPGVRAKEVRIIPQKELAKTLQPFEVRDALVDINWLSLLRGRLRIAHVKLDGFELVVNTKAKPKRKASSKNKSLKKEWEELNVFSLLESLPIDQIEVGELDLSLTGVPQTRLVKLEDINFVAFNDIDRLELAFATPNIAVTTPSKETLSVGTDIRLSISDSEMEVVQFKLTHLTSYVLANGYFTGDLVKLNFDRQNFDSRVFVDLNDVQKTLVKLNKAGLLELPELPQLSGQTRFEIKTDSQISKKAPYEIGVEANNLRIGESLIEQVFAQLTYQDQNIKVSEANFDLSSGKALIRDGQLSLNGPMNFNAVVAADSLELSQFLLQIGVGSIPVRAPISASLPCTGQIKPLNIDCEGQAEISDLQVWSDSERTNTIVKIGSAQASGKVNINDKQVSYTSDLQINDSTGKSDGVISYAKGFNINYEGKFEDVKRDIVDLVGLDLNGSMTIKGKTFGTSKYGRIELSAEGENFIFSDYDLGKVALDLEYKSSFLHFRNIKGTRGSSLYQGSFDINLPRSTISLSMNSPYLDLKDLKEAVKNKLEIPFPLEGTGAARVTLNAPLDLKTFDLSVKSSFYRGKFAIESFDQLIANINGSGDKLRSQKIQMRKANSLVELRGTLSSRGDLDTAVIGNRIRLEQSDWLNSFGLNLAGQLDFTSSLRGNVKDPKVELFGRLTQMTLADEPADDSRFRLSFDKDKFSGDGNFVGKTLVTEFEIPYEASSPFRFYLKAQDWDFTHFFNAFSGVSQKGYSTGLTGLIDLKSPNNWLWKASGKAEINKFFAKKGSKEISSKKPMLLSFNKGVVRSENFRVDGDSGFVNLEIEPSSRQRADLKLNGKFDMTFLSLLTPFLDDLRGTMSLSLNLKTRNDDIELLGSSYVQNGYVRLRGLPHAFEDITSDLLITHKNILINSLSGQFANGQMSGSGKVSFPGNGKIPISILSQFTNISPNIPDGFKTNGNANLYIRGDNIPYTLGGDYIINNGTIKTNLSGGGDSQGRIKPSQFLPKVLTGNEFEPLVLDLNVNMLRSLEVDVSVSGSDVKTDVGGSMRITGAPTNPRLKGTIKSEPGGTIDFRSNTFDIRSAFIEYQEDPPENPLLNITAISQVTPENTDEEDDLYEVTMDIRGRAKNPSISLTSQPQLSESDIISLLALGVTSSTFDQDTDNSQQVVQKGLEVGSQFLTEQLGINKTFQETTGFQVRITADEENPTVPKFTVRRQFTPKFGLSVGRSSDNRESNVKLEYKFNRNWSVVGQYETQEGAQTSTETTDDKTDTEKLGLDLEYKVEFR